MVVVVRRGGWGVKSVIGLTPHLKPPLPRPEPSTQIEMDFEVIRHTESFGGENRRDKPLVRA